MNSANNTTTYNRYASYTPMTGYTFADNEFGMLSAHMLSYCPPSITNVEHRVLGKVISRAIRFHKDNILLPMKHLLEGVFQDGECVDQPIPSDKKTIQKALDSLVSKGFFTMKLDTTCYPYINRCIIWVEKIKELFGMPKLNIGKKHKENSGGSISPRVRVEKYPSNSNKDKSSNKDKDQEKSSSSRQDTVRLSAVEIAEDIKVKSRTKRKKVLSTKHKFSGSAFARIWNAAFADFAETHEIISTKLTQLETGKSSKAFSNNPAFKRDDWHLFLTDVVSNWNEYHYHLNQRMKHHVPDHPTFSYFLKMSKHFLAVYQQERTTNVRVIGSDTAKIDSLKQENDKLYERIADLKEDKKLQSISKHQDYLDKVKRMRRAPAKQTHSLEPAGFRGFDKENY